MGPAGVYPAPVRCARRPRWVAPPHVGRLATTRSSEGGGRSSRRPGIPALDGVRAAAVALVLADHGGIPGMAGGFLGVDVFFVLSGFLITSLLLDELGRSGRIGLGDFWIRRARRLLPALVLMVLTVALGRRFFSPEAVAGLREDAVAAFFWVANWRFVADKTDYFTQGAPPSPLQHAWSLGVEEQYYIVWPLLLAAAAVVLAARARRRKGWATLSGVRLVVLLLATLGVLASATAAILLASDATRDRVYFGTDTRAQALLVGAAASALLVSDWSSLNRGWSLIRSRWGKWLARLLPVIGVVMLGIGTHYATGSARDFREGLLIAVAIAAALVIAPVALDQRGPVAVVLAWSPVAWLGTISYGVYLWHWPIFLVLNGERTGWSGLSLFGVRCVATLGVSTVSWWAIERPIRRWRPARVPLLPLAGATAATAAAVTMLVVPVSARPGGGPLDGSLPPGVSPVAVVSPSPPEGPRPARAIAQRDPRRPFTVSVFGDSIGWTLMHYLPPSPGFHFVDHTVIGCSLVRGGPYRYLGQTLDQKSECESWPSRWRSQIAADRPDAILLIVGRWETVDRVNEGRWTHIGDRTFDAYLTGELGRAVDILSSSGAPLTVANLPYSRRGERPDGSLWPEDQSERVKHWNTLLSATIGQRAGVGILDLNKKLCPDGVYTAKVDGIQVRSDGVHLTPEGVKWLAPWLEESLR
ncbi:acyltransferase family protein [Candidatus Mycobacterium methanotrophicum]|uniref:Acyltransferase n=1 Tax=Candidatus Mycobacterium methanotrophicum TaxID=2943498 RepID=A0ABY4QRM5_9MYCO|nr:acyltransferase family protein [Candidatus Mycobacterium methanotrophicum]UQX13316.1 acyltransferase [Candidatus Mycobacterium methanotrophicum]